MFTVFEKKFIIIIITSKQ